MAVDEKPLDFDSVLLSRKSIRSFRAEPVSDEELESLVDIARHAPSWMNKQCWHFIIVTHTLDIQDISKTSLTNHWMKKAPAIIILCADPHLSGSREGIDYYVVDAAIAMDHLILSATSKGLGTCWIGSFNEKKLKELLGVPPRIRIIALTPIGYPKEKKGLSNKVRSAIVRSTKRKSLSEICHWNQW